MPYPLRLFTVSRDENEGLTWCKMLGWSMDDLPEGTQKFDSNVQNISRRSLQVLFVQINTCIFELWFARTTAGSIERAVVHSNELSLSANDSPFDRTRSGSREFFPGSGRGWQDWFSEFWEQDA